jgi:hypothetical protein
MQPYILAATSDTPRVELDPARGLYVFEGNSYPENSTKLFAPILEWLEVWVKQSEEPSAVFNFNFDYFNTSSAKYILEVLRLLREYSKRGKDLKVRWYYYEDDTDMLEAGEDYMDTTGLEFELLVKEEED